MMDKLDFSNGINSDRKMPDETGTPTSSLRALWEDIRKDKIRTFRTFNLYTLLLVSGMLVNVSGVTLPDLKRNVDGTTKEMGYFVTARFFGACIGSLGAGWVFTKFHRLVVFTSLLLAMALLNFAVPFIKNVYLLIGDNVLISVFLGAVDTGANVLCMDLWMHNPGPFFQGLHFSYGIGSVIGPLVAEPFLSPEDEEASNSTEANSTTTEMVPTTLIPPHKDIGNVAATYIIISFLVLIICVSNLVSFLIDRTPIKSNTEKERVTNHTPGKILPRVLIGFGMLFLGSYVGLENVFAQFLTTFVMNSKLNMSKVKGSFMTSTFWGVYCFGRGISIFLATKFKPFHMLCVNLTVIASTLVVLSIFGESNPTVMWAGTAILGLGCSSTMPSMFAFLETYVGISNYVSGLLVVSASLGGFLLSLVVTQFMDWKPIMYFYMLCVACFLCISALAGQVKVVSNITKQRSLTHASSTEYLANSEQYVD